MIGRASLAFAQCHAIVVGLIPFAHQLVARRRHAVGCKIFHVRQVLFERRLAQQPQFMLHKRGIGRAVAQVHEAFPFTLEGWRRSGKARGS